MILNIFYSAQSSRSFGNLFSKVIFLKKFFACFVYIGLLLFDDRNINMNAILEFLWFPLPITLVISTLER